jgi:aryl carrier-like protein
MFLFIRIMNLVEQMRNKAITTCCKCLAAQYGLTEHAILLNCHLHSHVERFFLNFLT